ncbi:hypothetical protein FKW77_009634 [Venturia effusa]|uniref:Uncharacterized protein n=1 Tax=Venturia effusa TaxID=50376 RepID=A0A517L648_9PEZI|nr:hypothetical protein FKW77_009634 [Venturia effusa]
MRLGNTLLALAAFSSHFSNVLGRSITNKSTNLVKKEYTRPTSFDKTFADGEKLIAAMLNPPNKDDIEPRSLTYLYRLAHETQKVEVPSGSIPPDAALPAQKFGWNMGHPWHHTKWYVNEGANYDIVSETYFDDDSKTMIVGASFNDPLEKLFDEQNPPIDHKNLPYHSEIWVDAYGELMRTNQHLKYVMRDNIVNDDTVDIMYDARYLLFPKAIDADVVEVNRESDNIAEREAFIALAGSKNGGSLFRMITDRHDLFGHRQVVKVWLWGNERGQCDISLFCLPAMVWELADKP